MITLPGQLFHSTQIPACLWFLARNKNPGNGWHDRRGEVLFINARKLGHMVDRTRREFSDEDIARIAGTSHAWRKESGAEACEDEPGYCNAATLEEIGKHNHVLTPGRHVGAAAMEDDGVSLEDRMERLVTQLREQQAESARLDAAIRKDLELPVFGGLHKRLMFIT